MPLALPFLHNISVHVQQKLLVVSVPAKGKAVLMGPSGEQLYSTPLQEQENEVRLDWLGDGLYSLRIESGNDVFVRRLEAAGPVLLLK